MGENLKYLATVRAGCWLVCCSAQRPGRRRRATRWIGWSAEQRPRHLHLVTNHTSFLVLPWPGCRIWPAISWDSGRALVGRLAAEIRASDLLGGELRKPQRFAGPAIGPPGGWRWAHHQAHPRNDRAFQIQEPIKLNDLKGGVAECLWRLTPQALRGPTRFPCAERWAACPDRRTGDNAHYDGGHGSSAFSVFSFHPVPFSFCPCRKTLQHGQGAEQRPEPVPGRANPCDNHIRQTLDPVPPEELFPFMTKSSRACRGRLFGKLACRPRYHPPGAGRHVAPLRRRKSTAPTVLVWNIKAEKRLITTAR